MRCSICSNAASVECVDCHRLACRECRSVWDVCDRCSSRRQKIDDSRREREAKRKPVLKESGVNPCVLTYPTAWSR